jgi:hypothetical protein
LSNKFRARRNELLLKPITNGVPQKPDGNNDHFYFCVPNSFLKLIMGTGEVIPQGRWEGNHTRALRGHFTLRGKGIRKIWMIGVFI